MTPFILLLLFVNQLTSSMALYCASRDSRNLRLYSIIFVGSLIISIPCYAHLLSIVVFNALLAWSA